MNESDKDRIIERYNKRLSEFGPGIKALASGTEERRHMRFQVLTEIGIQSGDSVLDLGCGFGDFLPYLQNQKMNVDYTGVDINPSLIEEARKRFPSVRFEAKDIQKEKIGEFDYIVSTSCFNLKLQGQDNYEFIGELLKAAYAQARKGIAIDFLTSYVDFKGNEEEAFYYAPEKIFSIAKKITKRVTLRHDYPLFEFCIYMFPDFQGWQKK